MQAKSNNHREFTESRHSGAKIRGNMLLADEIFKFREETRRYHLQEISME
jgi:hypothetical protein